MSQTSPDSTSIIELVGKPYAFPSKPPETFDCFSVTQYVRKRFYNKKTPIENATVQHDMGMYKELSAPEEGCVVSMSDEHVGVKVGNNLITAMKNRGVCVIDWQVARRVYQLRFWDYVG